MEDLKICPFCGSEKVKLISRGTKIRVHCGYCGACGGDGLTSDEAIENWNYTPFAKIRDTEAVSDE